MAQTRIHLERFVPVKCGSPHSTPVTNLDYWRVLDTETHTYVGPRFWVYNAARQYAQATELEAACCEGSLS